MKSVPFNEPAFTYAEVLDATGVDNGWLRTLLQRDKSGRIGTKHRTGRLLFSLRDIAAIAVLWGLNSDLRIAPAAAWEVVNAAEAILGKVASPDFMKVEIHVAFADDSAVFVWRMDGDVIETWSDAADERSHEVFFAARKAHIVIPMVSLFEPVAKAVTIAAKWEES